MGSDRDISLYDVLQVSPDASPEVIRAAYRTLARASHPDLSDEPAATHTMRRLNAAYQTLSDPGRRAVYDELRARQARRAPSARAASPSPTVRSAGQRESSRAAARQRSVRAATEAAHQPDASGIARLGGVVLLAFAILAAIIVMLWLLGSWLDEDSPYTVRLEAAAQPVLNVG